MAGGQAGLSRPMRGQRWVLERDEEARRGTGICVCVGPGPRSMACDLPRQAAGRGRRPAIRPPEMVWWPCRVGVDPAFETCPRRATGGGLQGPARPGPVPVQARGSSRPPEMVWWPCRPRRRNLSQTGHRWRPPKHGPARSGSDPTRPWPGESRAGKPCVPRGGRSARSRTAGRPAGPCQFKTAAGSVSRRLY